MKSFLNEWIIIIGAIGLAGPCACDTAPTSASSASDASAPSGTQGDSCSASSGCVGGLACISKVCALELGAGVGEACLVDQDCREGACLESDAGGTRVCSPASCNAVLACAPSFQCVLDRGTPTCACQGVMEVCNGLDDDCDGIADNGDNPNRQCNLGKPTSTCKNGQCTCPRDECSGKCTDISTDLNNCGGCGQLCRGPASSCVSGQCVCVGEQPALCGNRCADLARDSHHCGTCDTACDPQQACVDGTCQSHPSCLTELACQQESCCLTLPVPGGDFLMGRGNATDAYAKGQANELPEHSVTVSPFYLDKYEVTGGRVARFVLDFDRWHTAGHPFAGEGEHENVTGTGWNPDWPLPASSAAFIQELRSCGAINWVAYEPTDTTYPGPSNCLTWYEAYAFCLWDGGQLPTEAEWEFAAAGGDENRLFPWGKELPTETLANCCSSVYDARPGSTPAGNGRYGQADLAGNLWEWVFDSLDDEWYAGNGATCVDCANTSNGSSRTIRGSSHLPTDNTYYRAAYRTGADPAVGKDYGFRCARSP